MFQAEDGIRDRDVTGVQTCALPICAINQHLSDEDKALDIVKNNIDRLISNFEKGIEGIIMTASGCGAMFNDYPHLLRNDEQYKRSEERRVGKECRSRRSPYH